MAAAACAWLLLLLAAPVEGAGVFLSAAAYAIGSFICHQQPERSFYLGAAQLPVCARCLGLYAGAAAGAVLVLANREGSRNGRTRLALAVAAVPTLVTWAIEFAGVAHPSNAVRAIAGLPLGAAVAIIVVLTASGRLR